MKQFSMACLLSDEGNAAAWSRVYSSGNSGDGWTEGNMVWDASGALTTFTEMSQANATGGCSENLNPIERCGFPAVQTTVLPTALALSITLEAP